MTLNDLFHSLAGIALWCGQEKAVVAVVAVTALVVAGTLSYILGIVKPFISMQILLHNCFIVITLAPCQVWVIFFTCCYLFDFFFNFYF